MTAWEPATEAEVAMRDALRAQDQQLYFRILTRTDLLLPVSAEALAGQAPMGWGTWTTAGRTHVLAFTSPTAMHACLGENAGTSRRVAYADLAADWPNHEWWLAVNPGLPIEGYLPAWFVAQLSRGDVRLPGRTMGARARLERAETAARAARASAATPVSPASGAPVSPAPGQLAPPQGEPATMPLRNGSSAPVPPAAPAVPPAAAAAPPTRGPVTAGRHPEPADPAVRVPESGGPAPVRAAENVGGAQPAVEAARPEATGSGGGEPGTPRSFFEPASRIPRRVPPLDPAHRTGDPPAPPSRLGRGGQPFPRRRPLNEPVPEEPTRAFRFDAPSEETTQTLGQPRPAEEPTRMLRVNGVVSGEEATQKLDWPRPAEEPTRMLRVNGASGEEATQALPRRRPPSVDLPDVAERTQVIARPSGRSPAVPPDEPAEVSPSIAEPVSGPPAPRRTLSPIVIEGTVIESRDLTETETARSDPRTPWAERRSRAAAAGADSAVAPEPIAVPTVPAAASALSTASTPPTASPADDEPAAPWAGSAEATVALAVDPTPAPAEQSAPAAPSAAPSAPVAPVAPAVPDEPAAAAPADTTDPAAAPPADTTDPAAAPPAEGADPATADGAPVREEPAPVDFLPANDVEEDLLGAAGSGSTDTFLSTLLLARVLLPVAADSAPGSRPGDPGFVWRTEELDGETYVVVYTSPERLADRVDGPLETVRVKFVQLIRRWPDEAWSFAVNPGTPVGAKYPGEQVVGLANWAAEVGLGDDPENEPEQPAAEPEPASPPRYAPAAADPTRPVTMQKAIAPSQLAYYLERGYDRVSGFVHRASELAHLTTPNQLYDALGLGHPDSPFSRDAEKVYVLRWPAYRPSLYRIPYGGQSETAMRAMEGWVIERAPFRGNGFAPGESSDVVAEFKVDSARLPHGAQLWRIGADGTERVIAILDTDALLWRQVGEP